MRWGRNERGRDGLMGPDSRLIKGSSLSLPYIGFPITSSSIFASFATRISGPKNMSKNPQQDRQRSPLMLFSPLRPHIIVVSSFHYGREQERENYFLFFYLTWFENLQAVCLRTTIAFDLARLLPHRQMFQSGIGLWEGGGKMLGISTSRRFCMNYGAAEKPKKELRRHKENFTLQ